MKILHYGIGYAPERTGGLVRYVTDLMEEQVKQNNEVAYLFPGKINIFDSSTKVEKKKPRIAGITSYEIINSLPLAVFGGVKNPDKFQEKVDILIYEEMLTEFNPEIIHVHSLMGIHKEFFEAAANKKIKIIYTSHDYFGLSPNPTFFFNGKSWDKENDLNLWLNISQSALPMFKLRIQQLPIYSKLRNTIKKFKKNSFQKEKQYKKKNNDDFPAEYKNSFESLRKYYQDIFRFITIFHFNSSISKTVFENNLQSNITSYKILPISNATILGGTRHVELDMSKVNKITYIGQYAQFKGFNEFIGLADKLQTESIKFEIYGEDIDILLPSNIINKGRFSSHDKHRVFEDIQLLIIPSKWKETFGFLGLEALDNNCPVLVNDNVGMKDLISNEFIFSNEKLDVFLKKLIHDSEKLKVNLNIATFSEHVIQMLNIYK